MLVFCLSFFLILFVVFEYVKLVKIYFTYCKNCLYEFGHITLGQTKREKGFILDCFTLNW